MDAKVAGFIFGCAVICVGARAQSLTVTTIAGSFWDSGSADGNGRAARFNFPREATVDSAGNLYINDTNNFTVRRISAAGVVTTLAGSPGAKGYVDGIGAAARFFQPRGMVRDTAGNLYLNDLDLARSAGVVRKITPAGVVSTFITQSGGGSALAIDAFNTLLVGGSSEVRTFAANGSEIFRDWPANLPTPGGVPRPPAGNFGNIWSMTLDRSGNLFIADIANRQIRKVTPARVMTLLAGGGGAGYADGFGTNARFNVPNSIVVDSQGNAYVGDANNAVLRRVSPAGEVTTVLGVAGAPPIFGPDGRVSFPDGTGGAARLSGPQALAIGLDDAIYIMDLHSIRKAVVVTIAAKVVTPPSSQILAAGERATFTVAANGNPAVSFQWQRLPAGATVWIDLADNAVYSGTRTAALTIAAVTSAMNGDRYRAAVRNSLGSDTSLPAQLVVDPPIVVVPLRVSTLAGQPGSSVSVDGTGSAARFFGPHAGACDANGNLYVSDISANAIRKITPGGVVTTLAGGGPAGWVDGVGRNARFQQPGSIAVDRAGNVFVLDRSISMDETIAPVVRKITPTGVVTTFLTAVPGGLPMRNFTCLAIDRAGNLLLFGYPGVYFRFTPAGVGTPMPIPPSPGTGTVTRIIAAAIDSSDTLYFSTIDATVLKLAPSGVLTLVAGRSGTPGAVDGRAAIALFRYAPSIAVDGSGNVYVADTGNQVIRRIDPAGIVSTVAGIKPTIFATAPTGWSDGVGQAVRFNYPGGVTVDRAGVLYIMDTANQVIRRGVRLDVVAAGERAELFALITGDLATEQAAAAARVGMTNEPARAAATSTDPTYQWFKDGVAVAGATATTLTIESARSSDAGNYTLQATSEGVTQMSEPVALSVRGSRLANLSIRSAAGTGAQTLTVGFVVENAGLPLLLRAIGPGLQPFGVTGMVPRPRLALHAGELALAESLGGANDVDIVDASTRAGAFVLPPESRDAALLTQLESGAFTAQCTDAAGGVGVALVELYDTSVDRAGRSWLINVSARSQVGVDDGVMIGGIAVSGTSPCRVLIRGIGPALTQFGVSGALADPTLSVFDAERRLRAQNDDWSSAANAGEIAAGMQRVGAFTLANGSKDAALVLSLEPGSYTVQLSGVGRTTGVGLIEVYELP